MKRELAAKQVEGKTFYYWDVGYERHGRRSFRLWINGRLVHYDEQNRPFVEFPVVGARIIRTAQGSLVLRPGEGVVYDVFVGAGYRGSGDFEVLAPEGAEEYRYKVFRSPQGSLGVSRGALVCVPPGEKLVIRWERSGRLYGNPPCGIKILYPNGEETDLEHIPDGLQELRELESLLQE